MTTEQAQAMDRTRDEKQCAPASIAVVNSHPIQYFAPLYAYLNAASDLEVTALYCTDASLRRKRVTDFGQSFVWDIDLLDGYQAKFLGPRARIRNARGFFSLIVPEIWTEIRSGKYEAVIIHGHKYAVYWLALLAAKLSGVKVMMRCETHLGLQRSRWKLFLRRPLIGLLCGLCDRLLAIGTANRNFYLDLGVPEEKICLVPYTVDNQRFTRASSLSDGERLRKLNELGVPPDRPVLLYASKFQRRKHPDDVLRAAAELLHRGAQFTLLMVGDGEMRDELERLVRELGLDNVVFAGFVNQSSLPTIYGVSDVFVLPSENEPWGLIVNEVMCAGLPVVVSDEVGCVPDLIAHGDNGFLFKAGDVRGLVEALHPLLADPQLRCRMGRRSRKRIESWSYQRCLEGLRQSLRGVKTTCR
jgi:glycosyltransferase involved in cell wall biosynthesis